MMGWIIYFRSPKIEVIVPEGYRGEIFITFGKKSNSIFLNEYRYKIEKNGLFMSEFDVPNGRIMGGSFCFTYPENKNCLPVVYGRRSDLLKKETGKTTLEHINFFLIEKAKNNLLNSKDTISGIA